MLTTLLDPASLANFVASTEKPIPVTIRLTIPSPFELKNRYGNPNELYKKSIKQKKKELAELGVKLEETCLSSFFPLFRFSPQSSVPFGSSTAYLGGLYSSQVLASVLPVLALSPIPGDFVLDLCAAPGSKAALLASFLDGKGSLLANDNNGERLKALQANFSRTLSFEQASVVTVLKMDATKIGSILSGKKADCVLLDAPCSGTGLGRKDTSVLFKRDEADICKRAELQKRLILAAFDALKKGGILVYSTCSVSVEENEEVVNYLLGKRTAKTRLVWDSNFFRFIEQNCDDKQKKGFFELRDNCAPGKLRNGIKIYNAQVSKCIRVWPHNEVLNTIGFFVARIEKV